MITLMNLDLKQNMVKSKQIIKKKKKTQRII